MNLSFEPAAIENYRSKTQIARVITENWVGGNMYCPRCGNPYIRHFENNRPVADFYCPNCKSEYELKSKAGRLGHKIADGAYGTMIDRIMSNHSPDFFFMSYSAENMSVTDFVVVPKHFFVPEMIEKRKPLAENARRSGWVGCNILIDKIPEQGRISVISNGSVCDAEAVVSKLNRSARLAVGNIESRGWLMDVLQCVNALPEQTFTLNEMYAFEAELQIKHPQNQNIRPKIRQQLQLLRDRGFVEFLGSGEYRKIE